MADWAYQPFYAHTVGRTGPRALITVFEDETEMRRRKSSAVRRKSREVHEVDKTTLDAMLDFYELKGMDVAFTKKTYDAKDPVDTEADFRFEKEPDYRQVGADHYQLTLDFIEVL